MYQAYPYNVSTDGGDLPPSAPAAMAPPHSELSDNDKGVLVAQGFPPGLIDALSQSRLAFPQRVWVVDNSGSMNIIDGKRYLPASKRQHDLKQVACSRWVELRETVNYHVQLAALLRAPTTVRLLNDPGRLAGPQISHVFGPEHASTVQRTLDQTRPSGATPLTMHVHQIQADLEAQISSGNWEPGAKLVLVLATDGLPTDARGVDASSEFASALRNLQGLPIWIVVRLCTDDDSVVDYYNQIDAQLELSIDILDDFEGEAKEVHEHNPWLNYALPLHRLREWGYSNPLFDLLDERPLTADELRDFLLLLLGIHHFDGVPDPQVDWKEFASRVENIVTLNEASQWNPMTHRMEPWVNMTKLRHKYSDGSDSHSCAIQ